MPIILANAPSFRLDWHRHAAWGVPAPANPGPIGRGPGAGPVLPGDAEFVALQQAYRPQGGLVRAEALAACLGAAGCGGYVDLARRIVAGQLFSFEWHHDIWLPVFQLDPGTLAVREGPRRVLDELRGVLDGWALARWHVQPHAALGGRLPLDLLAPAPPAGAAEGLAQVLDAARAERARTTVLSFKA